MLREELFSARELLESEEYDYLLSCINTVPDRDTAVHGDFHARNIMMLNDKPLLIDMDDFCAGHPLWDVACIYRIYQYLVNLDPEVARDLLDIPEGMPYSSFYYRIIKLDFEESANLWDLFVKKYFEDYTNSDVERMVELVAFYSDLMVIRFLLDRCRILAKHPEKLSIKKNLIKKILSRMKEHDLEELKKIFDIWR